MPYVSDMAFQGICGDIFGWKNSRIRCLSIDLNKFENEVIDIICDNNFPIAVFPVSDDDTGKIVDLDTFVKDLFVELENYR